MFFYWPLPLIDDKKIDRHCVVVMFCAFYCYVEGIVLLCTQAKWLFIGCHIRHNDGLQQQKQQYTTGFHKFLKPERRTNLSSLVGRLTAINSGLIPGTESVDAVASILLQATRCF